VEINTKGEIIIVDLKAFAEIGRSQISSSMNGRSEIGHSENGRCTQFVTLCLIRVFFA
jgi:hypothetical protein